MGTKSELAPEAVLGFGARAWVLVEQVFVSAHHKLLQYQLQICRRFIYSQDIFLVFMNVRGQGHWRFWITSILGNEALVL